MLENGEPLSGPYKAARRGMATLARLETYRGVESVYKHAYRQIGGRVTLQMLSNERAPVRASIPTFGQTIMWRRDGQIKNAPKGA